MMRPRKMKQIEITVLTRDVDPVIEYLGRRGLMHFSSENSQGTIQASVIEEKSPELIKVPPASLSPAWKSTEQPKVTEQPKALDRIREKLDLLNSAAVYLGVEIPIEPEEDTLLPGETEEKQTVDLSSAILALGEKENEQQTEKKKLEETIAEAQAFSKLNAPFSDLDQLSYLTLRVGRLDPRRQDELREQLSDRAVIIPLDDTGRILTASSRKGRFAMDSALKKTAFAPIAIPENYKGIPADLLTSLQERIITVEKELETIAVEKEKLKDVSGQALRKIAASYLMARAVEELKKRLRGTKNVFVISGWIPADEAVSLAEELGRRTEGRTAIRSYNPEELEAVAEGREKVPVSLKHGAFVKGFEPVVFSYGAPLYGALDPTPFVAFFFSLLFGIMFGDVGQGLVLLLLGFAFASKSKNKFIASFKHFSTPLKAVGIASILMGFLNGEFFTNERILVKPTQAFLGFFMNLFGMAGELPERILQLMPERGSIAKLYYFFGFTIAVGVILNSIGLVVNIVNQCSLKKYEKAFFDKTGLAGLLLFWYALFIAIRIITGGRFENYDFAGLAVPVVLIFFGPVIGRFISGERPALEHGLTVFIMEGFVELLESVSAYVSNTVSFLRVGAFALSHAVLSFIVFTLSELVQDQAVGPLFSLLILVAGNAIIILLEGMIVAIQVIRLQYYEFFGKFFTETGVAFAPFRFRAKTG